MTPLDAARLIFDALAVDDEGHPVPDLDGLVDAVYLIEPRAGVLATPVAATISIDGMTPYELEVTLRVYGKLGLLDAIEIQRRVVAAWAVCDALIDETSVWTRGTWSQGYDANLDAFIAECPMIASRTDF